MGRHDDRPRALDANCPRRAGGVRARIDPRPHQRRPRAGQGARAELGPTLQADPTSAERGDTPPRPGRDAHRHRAQLQRPPEHDFKANCMKPARLFHYQRFVEAHLISLLSAGQLKLSRPDSFNDPWDCRVRYQGPKEPDEIKRVLAYFMQVHSNGDPSISEDERQRLLIEFIADTSTLEVTFLELEKQMYAAICTQYRIYCLTEHPASPLMWGHYAASHTGICLEFDARCYPFPEVEKVEYRTTYPAWDLSTVYYEPLITKSMHWAYEAEWRLIAEDRAAPISLVTIKTNNDF